MKTLRVWLCVWFACLCLAQAKTTTLKAGSQVFVLGAVGPVPGPVSLFKNKKDCEDSVVPSSDSHHKINKCVQHVLAANMEFILLEVDAVQTWDDYTFKLGQCAPYGLVTSRATCPGGRENPPKHLCVLMAPGNEQLSTIQRNYCGCQKITPENLDFTAVAAASTYKPQLFACVTNANFAASADPTAPRKDTGQSPMEPQAASQVESQTESQVASRTLSASSTSELQAEPETLSGTQTESQAELAAQPPSIGFVKFVHQVKQLPETVILTEFPRALVEGVDPITSDTFNLEFQKFKKLRQVRKGQSEEYDGTANHPAEAGKFSKDPEGEWFFIERVALEVKQPRLHVWGDIHGSIHSLLRTLQQVGVKDDWTLENPRDVLIFLGDYVDRGDYGFEVLFTLTNLFNMNPNNVIIVRGNHETKPIADMYGLRQQLIQRFKLTGVQITEIYSLFNLLPAAVYLRDPKYDQSQSKPAQFYMFAHGGIQLSFDPSRFLAYSPAAPIVRGTFTNKDLPKAELVTNIIGWAEIGDISKAIVIKQTTTPESSTVTLPMSEWDAKDQISKSFGEGISEVSGFETVSHPGFMWNDMTTDDCLHAAEGRGYALPRKIVENYVQLYSIKTIFRAHQHNGPFHQKLQANHGLYIVYPKTEISAEPRSEQPESPWSTRDYSKSIANGANGATGWSAAYTLNSSPGSGLKNHFDSYVILDFETPADSEPLFSHRFCLLPAPSRDGVRRGIDNCWHKVHAVEHQQGAKQQTQSGQTAQP